MFEQADASSLSTAGSNIRFPTQLFLFNDTASSSIGNNIANTVAQAHNDVFTVATENRNNGKKDSKRNNDQRPFYITIDNQLQAYSLRFSIIRILISTMSISEQWIHEFIPDVLELIIDSGSAGEEEEHEDSWKLYWRHGQSMALNERIHVFCQRIDCVMRLFKLSDKVPLPQAYSRIMLSRIIDLFLSLTRHRQEEIANPDNIEEESVELSAFRNLERILANAAMLVYEISKETNTNKRCKLADIARIRRRDFIDILLSEKASIHANAQHVAPIKCSDRQKFCLAILVLGSVSQERVAPFMAMNTALQDITNLPTESKNIVTRLPQAENVKGASSLASLYTFDEKDARDILETLNAYHDKSSSRNSSYSEKLTLTWLKQELRSRCVENMAHQSAKGGGHTLERVGEKRKAAPDDNDICNATARPRRDDQRVDSVTQGQLAELRAKFAFNTAIERASTSQLLDLLPALEIFREESSKKTNVNLKEEHFQAVEILACDASFDNSEREPDKSGKCRLCQRQFIMAILPSRDQEHQDVDGSSIDISKAIKDAHLRITEDSSSSNSTRIAFWRAFSAILIHAGEQSHSLYGWLQIISSDLKHQNRLVRLSAGYAGNMIITELFRHNPALSPNGQLSSYFVALETGLKHVKPSTRLTTATVVADLIRCVDFRLLQRTIC